MCGIWLYLTKYGQIKQIIKQQFTYYNRLKPRGPDQTRIEQYNNIGMVFHRLAINDLNDEACMPFVQDNVILICNGEIYNHNELKYKHQLNTQTKCDCEVIIQLYNKYKYKYKHIKNKIYNKIAYSLCNELDGEFAFMLYDMENNILLTCRDPYGVRPLFIGVKHNYNDSILNSNDYNAITFSSELKGINDREFSTAQFKACHYMIIDTEKLKMIDYNKYIDDFCNYDYKNMHFVNINEDIIYSKIKKYFVQAIEKRVKNSDRGVACLLSGGLDSSLVASIASRYFEPYTLETYCIGLEGSPDMKYAQIVADFIKSKHTNIIVNEKEMLDSIENVIRITETYDTTTIRASIVNYLAAKYISQHSTCKVLLTGEYSDEIFLSYIYSKYMDNEEIFYNENMRLVNEIHYFDALRADRVISSNGLEARFAFSDKKFVDFIMRIKPSIKMPKNCKNIEKYILRKAFDYEYNKLDNEIRSNSTYSDDISINDMHNKQTLPNEILWRVKEAFSDGVSSNKKSWFEILQEFIEKQISDEEYEKNKDLYTHIEVKNKEMYYYVKTFCKYYTNISIIPYLWVPRNSHGEIFTHEPSARILKDIYE